MGLISWLENNLLDCPYKKYFDIDCMGCGMQRSFLALIKGNFADSFYYYPALFPMLFMFLFLILHVAFKFKNGARWLMYHFIFNMATVVISYVIKLFL